MERIVRPNCLLAGKENSFKSWVSSGQPFKHLMMSLVLDIGMGSYSVSLLGEREGYPLQSRIMAKGRCIKTHFYLLGTRRQ